MTATVGQQAPPLSLSASDGTVTTLDPASATATVVVFTANQCPYALAWHDRLQQVARDYAAHGVSTIYISSNDAAAHPGDSLDAMQRRVSDGDMAGPYLYDERQCTARAWGAEVTPHVYVVDGAGTVRYVGAPDADYDDETLRAAWLRSALDDLLAGRDVALPATQASGCTIKWRVELAYWDGCPSHPAALRLVEELLSELGRSEVRVQLHRVNDQQQAAAEGFVGSPTVRVGGVDLVPAGTDEPPALACRVYRTEDGRISPLPARAVLKAALQEALARPWERPGWVDFRTQPS